MLICFGLQGLKANHNRSLFVVSNVQRGSLAAHLNWLSWCAVKVCVCVCLLLWFASTTATKSIRTDCRPDFRHRDKCSVLHGQTFYNTKKENTGGISRTNDLVVWLDCVTDQTIWQRVNNAISQQFFVYLWLRQNQRNRWFIWLLLLLFLASMANCMTYNLFVIRLHDPPGSFSYLPFFIDSLLCFQLKSRPNHVHRSLEMNWYERWERASGKKWNIFYGIRHW